MSITRSTVANLGGGVFPAAISLVAVPLYIQLVGHERYGVLLLIWVLLGYFGVFDLGLGRAVAQQMAASATASPSVRSRLFWTALLANAIFGVVGGLLLWRVVEIVAGHWIDVPPLLQPEFHGVAPWLGVAVPLMTISGVLTGALQGREEFVRLNIVQTLGAVLSQLLPLLVAAWTVDMRYLVPTVLSTRALTALMLLAVCHRRIPVRGGPVVEAAALRPLLRYGGWITVTGIVGPLLTTVDRLVIGGVAGTTAVTMFSVPSNLLGRISLVPASLFSALFPRFAVLPAAEGDVLLARAVRGLIATLTPLILFSMLAIQPFLSWWVGKDFSGDAATVGEIVALGLWVNSLAYIPYARIQAEGRPDIVAKCHLLELGPYIALLWVAVHSWGVVGAAIAWTVRAAADAALLFWLARTRTQHAFGLGGSLLLLTAMAVVVFALVPTSPWRATFGGCVLLASGIHSWRNGGSDYMHLPFARPLSVRGVLGSHDPAATKEVSL